MNREEMRQRLRDAREAWDVLIVGGGATGLGCALDAASRGLKVALVEQADFAKGTSSRSTKLFHGGVRYLRGGQVGLVAQSLRERETLRRNAPQMVRQTAFLIPACRWFEKAYYGAGVGLYEWLSRRGGATSAGTRTVSRAEALSLAPTLRPEGLRGGVIYHDDQFDDARFAFELARAAAGLGSAVLNYARAESLLESNGRVGGAVIRDLEDNHAFEVQARVVVNAGGIYADAIRRLWRPSSPGLLRFSRGVHLMVERAFLPGETAVLVPRTDDGRVVFLIPWRNRLMIGTTDTPVDSPVLEPSAAAEDVDFLLAHAARYLLRAPSRNDVRSVFAGLRPLPARGASATSKLRRDHRVQVTGGMVTIAGGKWTTYRLMAEEAIDAAVRDAGLRAGASRTRSLSIARAEGDDSDRLESRIIGGEVSRGLSVDDRGTIERMAREEMVVCVEDVLARRTRSLFLDARAASDCARPVAGVLAASLGRDAAWVDRQVAELTALATRYLPPGGA